MRTFDFDRLAAEIDAEPIKIRVLGREWDLPPIGSVSAKAVLDVQRQMDAMRELAVLVAADPDAKVPEHLRHVSEFDWMAHARTFCGDANVEAWLEQGIGTDLYRQVLSWAVGVHLGLIEGVDPVEGGDDDRPPAKAPRKAPARKKAARSTPSTRGSARSKRTSTASTKQT